MHFSWICVFICWMVAVNTPGTRSIAIDLPEHIHGRDTLDDDNNTESESAGEEKPLICYACSGYLNAADGKQCGRNVNITTIECYGEMAMCYNDVSKPNHISRGCQNDCLRVSKNNRRIYCCDEPKCNNQSVKELAKIPVAFQARLAPAEDGAPTLSSTTTTAKVTAATTAATKSTESGATGAVVSTTSATTGKTTKKSMGNNLAAPALMLLTASIVGIVAPVHVI